jgi:hypothetical protein
MTSTSVRMGVLLYSILAMFLMLSWMYVPA